MKSSSFDLSASFGEGPTAQDGFLGGGAEFRVFGTVAEGLPERAFSRIRWAPAQTAEWAF